MIRMEGLMETERIDREVEKRREDGYHDSVFVVECARVQGMATLVPLS